MSKQHGMWLRSALFVALMFGSGAWGYAAVRPPNVVHEDVLSFEMWCLEMRLYPAQRCDARQADDIKAYERYRAMVEQFQQTELAKQRRDQELRDRLNPQGPAQKGR